LNFLMKGKLTLPKILFVCSGNTCRSPMAEALASHFHTDKNYVFLSRGVSVFSSSSAEKNAVDALRNLYDINLLNHRATQISEVDVHSADVIAVMTASHKAYLEDAFPTIKNKIKFLTEFSDDDGFDIPDPFGGDLDCYMQCAKRIKECVEKMKSPEKSLIAIGCDQGGFALMQSVRAYLNKENIDYTDFGSMTEESIDYPIIAENVTSAVLSGECSKGILICGTGIGVSIAANRNKGIRAALCHDVFSAKATRLHNDANILAMGGRVIGPGLAEEIINAFLTTDFSGEDRHTNRVKMLG